MATASAVSWEEDRSILADRMMSCDAFVFSITDDCKTRHYCSPLKIFEYIETQKPIIFDWCESLREIDLHLFHLEIDQNTNIKEALEKFSQDYKGFCETALNFHDIYSSRNQYIERLNELQFYQIR